MNLLFKLAAKFGLPSWLAALVAYLVMVSLAFGAVWAIYDFGKRDERADWQAKQLAEAAQAQSTIDRLTIQNQALGQLSLGLATAAKTHYEQELAHEKDNFNRTIADVRTGAKRLSISTKAVPACAGGIALAAQNRPDTVAETRTELSTEAAEFIVRYGAAADREVIDGNYIRASLGLCYAHLDRLELILNPLGLKPATSNLTTFLQLNSQPKEISND